MTFKKKTKNKYISSKFKILVIANFHSEVRHLKKGRNVVYYLGNLCSYALVNMLITNHCI